MHIKNLRRKLLGHIFMFYPGRIAFPVQLSETLGLQSQELLAALSTGI